MKYDRYCPEDQQQFDEMVKYFLGAESAEELSNRTVLFIFDMRYSRQDIIVAQGRVSEEKGFGK